MERLPPAGHVLAAATRTEVPAGLRSLPPPVHGIGWAPPPTVVRDRGADPRGTACDRRGGRGRADPAEAPRPHGVARRLAPGDRRIVRRARGGRRRGPRPR